MKAHGTPSYSERVKGSQDDIEWLGEGVVRDLEMEFFEPYHRILDLSNGTPWAKWFAGGKINLAHNCVDRWARAAPESPAVVWQGEEGTIRTVSYAELLDLSNRLASGLRELGGGQGDRLGIFLPK